jgi:rRNA processing protein Gar1
LGKILHIVNGEAITQPASPFTAKNSRVYLKTSEEIGILGDPFGNANQPYQPILLKKNLQSDLVGADVIARIYKKRRKSRRRYRKSTSKKK